MNDLDLLFLILVVFEAKHFFSSHILRGFMFSHVERGGYSLRASATFSLIDGLMVALIAFSMTSADLSTAALFGLAECLIQFYTDRAQVRFDNFIVADPILAAAAERSSILVDRAVWFFIGFCSFIRRFGTMGFLWFLASDGLIYLQ